MTSVTSRPLSGNGSLQYENEVAQTRQRVKNQNTQNNRTLQYNIKIQHLFQVPNKGATLMGITSSFVRLPKFY
jgi:hypothetical protein